MKESKWAALWDWLADIKSTIDSSYIDLLSRLNHLHTDQDSVLVKLAELRYMLETQTKEVQTLRKEVSELRSRLPYPWDYPQWYEKPYTITWDSTTPGWYTVASSDNVQGGAKE